MGAGGTAHLARIVLARELRHRWRGLVLLGVLATLWATVTMSAVAGARRTASVIDRFQRETVASDADFSIFDDFDGEDLYRALLARPEVLTAELRWSAGTGLAYDRGIFVGLSGGVTGVWGRDIDRPIVVRGRTADPSNADEVMVSSATADLLDIEPGDHLDIPTWDSKEWEAWLKVRGDFPPFNGPLVHVVVVGVVRTAWDLEATQDSAFFVLTTPAFGARWGSAIGQNSRTVVVALRDPDLDPGTLVEPLTVSLGKTVSIVSAEDAYVSHAGDAADAQAAGLLVIAVAAGLTGALLVGFAVAREMRRSADRYQPIVALGATPRQRALAVSAPIAVVAIATSVVSVTAAGLASMFFPVGSARAAEPTRGVWPDVPILAAGAPIVVFLMLAVAMSASLRSAGARSADQKAVTRFTAVLGRVGPSAMVGQMNALGTRERRSTLVAAVVTFVGLTSTAWFAHSLHDLERSPQRWGYTWSSSPESGFGPGEWRAAVDSTLADPDVAGVGLLYAQTAIVAGRPVDISTFDSMGGVSERPHVLSGRLPLSSREIALGRRTAKALRVEIGDRVWIDSVALGQSAWTVVGLIVPPTLLSTTNPGDGAFTLPTSHAELFEGDSAVNFLTISYRPGADVRRLEDRLKVDPGWKFDALSHARQPGAIATLTGVSVLLPWLAGFFVVLGLGATTLAAVRRGTPRRTRRADPSGTRIHTPRRPPLLVGRGVDHRRRRSPRRCSGRATDRQTSVEAHDRRPRSRGDAAFARARRSRRHWCRRPRFSCGVVVGRPSSTHPCGRRPAAGGMSASRAHHRRRLFRTEKDGWGRKRRKHRSLPVTNGHSTESTTTT